MNLDSSEVCLSVLTRVFACQGVYHILILKLFLLNIKQLFLKLCNGLKRPGIILEVWKAFASETVWPWHFFKGEQVL